MLTLQGIAGIVLIVVVVWMGSENRRAVSWKLILGGLAFQILLGLILLKLPGVSFLAEWLNRGIAALEAATTNGSSMVFGYLGGAPLPFDLRPGSSLFAT